MGCNPRLGLTKSRPVASTCVATARTFNGVHLCVPTAFGIIATSWPFARISIGEAGVELISSFPLRSEWYSQLDEVSWVKSDPQNILIARADGSTARFRFWSRSDDAIVAALVENGLPVRHVDEICNADVRQGR